MRKMHPFDLYILQRDNKNIVIKNMTRPSEYGKNGNILTYGGDVLDINGENVIVTTTVPPITTEII